MPSPRKPASPFRYFNPSPEVTILAEDEPGRCKALDKLLPEQRSDFVETFEVMAGLPCTIRPTRPAAREFLPHDEFEQVARAAEVGVDHARRATSMSIPPSPESCRR